MIKFVLYLNILLTVSLSAQSFYSTDSTSIIKKEKDHLFEFQITKALFDTANHNISSIDINIIDGQPAWGLNWSVPKYEIKTMKLKIDSMDITIPKELFGFCYNPNLDSEYVNAYWGKDYKSIFVFMNGGDGVGGYTIAWYFDINGNHSYMIPRYDDFMFKTQW